MGVFTYSKLISVMVKISLFCYVGVEGLAHAFASIHPGC